jgi:hypothetical protein
MVFLTCTNAFLISIYMHVFQYHELWLRGRAEGYHARGFKFKTNSGLQFFLSIMPLNANFKENMLTF